MIDFQCAGCGAAFRAGDHLAGRRTRCKHCGAETRVPSPESVVEAGETAPMPRLGPRIAAARETEAPARRPVRRKKRKPRGLDRDAWTSLAIGAALAGVALAVPLIGVVAEVLKTVIHEMGHTATAWIFGCPAVPSFDLTYGGGVSLAGAQQPLLLVAIHAVFAYLIWRERDDRPRLVVMLAVLGIYSVAAFSPLRELLILAMGHGMELVIAGIFVYRAMSGSQILRGEERPLYAFLGLYLILSDALFAGGLIASHEHRADYEDAKGGGHAMDFSRIAEDHLHVRLEVVAGLFLLICVVPMFVAFLAHRFGRRRP